MKMIVTMIALAGCGKKTEADEGDEFAAKMAREDLPKAKAAVASKKPIDGMVQCGSMGNLASIAKVDKALADETKQVCGHDLWAAQIKISVEQLEARRAAKPDEEAFIACSDPYLAMANDELVKANNIDEATHALLARYTKLCPDGLKKK
jgi:hypothetical protein